LQVAFFLKPGITFICPRPGCDPHHGADNKPAPLKKKTVKKAGVSGYTRHKKPG